MDTHIFLFFINGDKSIQKETVNVINNPNTDIYLSIVSIWEIVIKMNIGKLKLKDDVNSIYILLSNYNIKILDLKEHNFKIYSALPLIHKDPFDRMIISQAIAEDLTIISDDQYIRNYPNLKLL
ncbi:type II toxin-antitoxin system VapC family toxin [Pedobacter sp. SJ11]|uniref:Type II toxin-antitoxin system VapC family toxin n=1 Tax=Pedobacter rhodius TaxID=3004098 RepID=A0ABT4KV15_9SPHI|nr:type II toxin-antitoxin system VapC family toxin [Pedobacter sp. SJ11]